MKTATLTIGRTNSSAYPTHHYRSSHVGIIGNPNRNRQYFYAHVYRVVYGLDKGFDVWSFAITIGLPQLRIRLHFDFKFKERYE